MTARAGGPEASFEEADPLFGRDESLGFANVHRIVRHLIPLAGARILDIGAGTGRDAAVFAAMGHSVLAVEPAERLRTRAMMLRASPRIEWLDDSLPELSLVRRRGETFDGVLLTAVWMHLDGRQRRQGMPAVASLLRHGGVMILSLRHGPAPRRRRLFDVSAEETIGLAQAEGLAVILNLPAEPVHEANRLAGVTWTRLAFRKQR